MQLKRVVEIAGMKDHVDFVEQPTMTGQDAALRPDMIVHLPGGKTIVIDAKTPLDAWLEANESTDDTALHRHLLRHTEQVRTHILQLSRKQYKPSQTDSPDFVVMFLPDEGFLSEALRHDPTLLQMGAEKNVMLATPITLVTLLRAVALGWRQEQLAENARKISAAGQELYGRLMTFSDHLQKAGRGLGSALDGYNSAVASLESRVFPTARRFEELGAVPKGKALPALPTLDKTVRQLVTPEQEPEQVA